MTQARKSIMNPDRWQTYVLFLFILLAGWCLKVLEHKARREGRLTVRGQ